MWARSVCINNGLVLGSVLPMLDYAKANGFSVIILNPNMSHDPLSRAPIPCSQTMTTHCRYVWEKLILKSPARKIALVAHSAGGMCTSDLIDKFKKDFFDRCQALVFTDAGYHSVFSNPSLSKEMLNRLSKISIHFKAYRNEHKEVGVEFKN